MMGLVSKKKTAELLKRDPDQDELNGYGTLDTSGIDDREIKTYLLTKEESRIKSMLWAKLNDDYIRKQQSDLILK
jgi:hypothetical protein